MKLIFEGKILEDIIQEMEDVLAVIAERKIVKQPEVRIVAAMPPSMAQPVEKPVARPMEKPVEKPVEKRARTEKQKANDEKLRIAALARIADKKFAKEAAAIEKPVKKLVEKMVEELVEDLPDPIGKEPEVDPVEMIKLREKTLEELRASFANGHQEEVMELLSRFGNGAKSFRELPPEAFPEIRKAIDLGALG